MLLDVVDETIGAGIVTANCIGATKLWLNDLGQLFTQFNTNINNDDNKEIAMYMYKHTND